MKSCSIILITNEINVGTCMYNIIFRKSIYIYFLKLSSMLLPVIVFVGDSYMLVLKFGMLISLKEHTPACISIVRCK